MNPSDPAARWCDCVTLYDDDYPMPIYVRDLRCPPRATIQRRAASEVGADFNDVRVVARWGRIYTRQEVWDAEGSESWASEQGWGEYKTQDGSWHWRSDDDVGDAERDQVELVTKDGSDTGLDWSGIEERFVPAEPPADWRPSDLLPAWRYCSPLAPGATPLYIVEEN